MMQIFQKRNGAVSVFLALVLIPMMMVASIMIDYGRVKLGGAMASSAGDLALNTALSQYDNVLKDMYGLMATSQSNDELLEKLEDYYTTSILAQGVSQAQADDYVGQIMDTLKGVSDQSSTDFMRMNVTDFNVVEPKEASLLNPAILRGQIVNFMKFRAPINGGMALLESLKSFSHLGDQMKMVEDKQAYYKVHAEVMDKCQAAWQYMEQYRQNCPDNFYSTSKATIEGNGSNQGYQEKWRYINENILKNYYNNSAYFNNNTSCTFTETDGVKDWNLTVIGAPIQKTNYYNSHPTEVIEDSKVQDSFKSCLVAYNIATDVVNPYKVADIYQIQVVIQFNEDSSKYIDKSRIYFESYYDLKDIYDHLSDDQKKKHMLNQPNDPHNLEISDDETLPTVEDVYNSFTAQFDSYFTEFKSFTDTISSYYVGNLDNYTSTEQNVNSNISEVGSSINGIKEKLINGKTALSNCKGELVEISNDISANGSLTNARAKWSRSANNNKIKNDSIAQQDQAEIKQMEDFIKVEDVNALITRVDAAINSIQAEINELEKFKYCGQYLGNYSGISSVKGKITEKVNPTIGFTNTDLNSLASNTFTAQFEKGNFVDNWNSDKSKSPVFSDNRLRFYTYLYNNYHNETTNTVVDLSKKDTSKNEQKNLEKKIKDQGKLDDVDKKESTSSNGIDSFFNGSAPTDSQLYQDILNGNYAPPSIDKDTVNSGNTSSGLTGLFTQLANTLANASVDIRDYIYIEEYIMSMFSYDTYSKEIISKYEDDNENATIDENNDEYKKRAVTLTKVPINSSYNYAYEKEVEYIIYGDDNGAKKAYGTIYAIRVGLNSIYAFTNTEIRNGAYAMASAMFATPPLTPLIPVAQVAIIIAISLAESGIDLMELKEGKAVPLIKDDKTWQMSFERLLGLVKNEARRTAQELVSTAADKSKAKLNDWLDLTEEELQSKVNRGGKDLNQLVATMEKNANDEVDRYIGVVTNEITTLCTKAKDAVMYREIDAGDRVNYIKTELNKWWQSQTGVSVQENTLAYKIEEAAVNYLTTSADGVIQELLNEMDNVEKNANGAIGDMGDKINEKIRKISDNTKTHVTNTCTEINSYITNIRTDLQQAANQGIDQFHDKLNNGIGKLFGTDDNSTGLDIGKQSTTSLASMFKFRYSDYLKVFLLVGLVSNGNTYKAIMGRTSDVIEANMRNMTGGNSNFRISKSYVYLKIDSTIEVKPLLMTLPFMKDVTDANTSTSNGKNFYTITYSGLSGY